MLEVPAEADILRSEKKATKFVSYKCFGQFGFIVTRQRPENSLTPFKRRFSANSALEQMG